MKFSSHFFTASVSEARFLYLATMASTWKYFGVRMSFLFDLKNSEYKGTTGCELCLQIFNNLRSYFVLFKTIKYQEGYLPQPEEFIRIQPPLW